MNVSIWFVAGIAFVCSMVLVLASGIVKGIIIERVMPLQWSSVLICLAMFRFIIPLILVQFEHCTIINRMALFRNHELEQVNPWEKPPRPDPLQYTKATCETPNHPILNYIQRYLSRSV